MAEQGLHKKRRGWGNNVPFEGMPPVTRRPLAKPRLLKFPPPHSSSVWETLFQVTATIILFLEVLKQNGMKTPDFDIG
jgi:hypothetical protein